MFQWDIGPEPTEPYSNIHLMLLNGKTSYNFSMISPNIDVLYIPSLNLVLYCNRHCFISNPMCRVKTRKMFRCAVRYICPTARCSNHHFIYWRSFLSWGIVFLPRESKGTSSVIFLRSWPLSSIWRRYHCNARPDWHTHTHTCTVYAQTHTHCCINPPAASLAYIRQLLSLCYHFGAWFINFSLLLLRDILTLSVLNWGKWDREDFCTWFKNH